MNILEDSKNIIVDMLDFKKPFSVALKNYLATNVRSQSELVTIDKIYRAFFDNYYLYEEITKEYLTKRTNVLVAVVGIVLASAKIVKINSSDYTPFLEDNLQRNKEKVSDEFNKFIYEYSNGIVSAPKGIVSGSYQHLSILFNLPVWLISMLINQQGKDVAKGIFKSFKAKYSNYYIHNALVDIDSIEKSELASFEKVSENLYLKKGKSNILVDNFSFVKIDKYLDTVFNYVEKANNKYVTLYQAEKSYFYFRFLKEYLYRNNVLNIAVESLDENPELINHVSLKNLNYIFTYKSTIGELIARLAFKQDLLFYFPKSTNMEKMYYCPEYRVEFDTMNIDGIIKQQIVGLKEISTFVSDGGILIYLVNTIDKKETTGLIKEFLKDNQDFSLLSEYASIPTSEDAHFGYFAILKRKNHA